MGSVAAAARLVLAAALTVAALAKLRARVSTRSQTIALVGGAAGPAVAVALPFAELAIALMLVFWWSAVPGVIAAVLLGFFTGVVIRAEVRHLPCPCFGGGTARLPLRRAVGPAAVLRNGVLLACAVLATGSPGGATAGASLAWSAGLGAVAGTAIWLAR